MSINSQLTVRITPTNKQKTCWGFMHDQITKFVFFGGGAGGGKSWFGCEWVLTEAITHPGIKLFIGRNELKRLMGSTYITWLKVCKHHKIPKDIWKLNSQYNFIEFINFETRQFDGTGSRIDLLDVAWQPSDPLYERFGSTEYTSGWLEEVGEIKEAAFDVLKSRIGRHQPDGSYVSPKLLLTGNPKKNWNYYSFYKPWKENCELMGEGHEFEMIIGIERFRCAFIQSLYKDNPYTVEEYEHNLKSIRDKVLRERLMNGNWEYENDDSQLMEYDRILDIFRRDFSEELNGPYYLSVDVARFGRDKAVIILWQGLYIKNIFAYDKSSMTFLKDRILSKCEQYGISRDRVVIDEDGVGGGLVDELEGCIGFVNGSRAVEEITEDMQDTDKYSYKNLRSQCYFKLADYINDGKIGCYNEIPNDIQNTLISELEAIRRKDVENNEKKLQVISKEDIKDIIGNSPDFADATMMRMYFELGLQQVQDIAVVF